METSYKPQNFGKRKTPGRFWCLS